MQLLKPRDLVRLWAYKVDEDLKLGAELAVRFVERLEEARIASEKKAAQTGLFIQHQLGKTIGLSDDAIGAIDSPRALFDTLETIAENQGEDGQCSNRDADKTSQKSVIKPCIHDTFPQPGGLAILIASRRDGAWIKIILRKNGQARRDGTGRGFTGFDKASDSMKRPFGCDRG